MSNDEWLETPAAMSGNFSDPCKLFFCDYVRYMNFVDTIFRIARTADQSSRGLTVALSALSPPKEVAGTLAAAAEEGIGADTLLGIYAPLVAEMLWCRGVDNFLTYVGQLLGLVFCTRPETLRSSKTETLEAILRFKSMEELVDHIAEKRVYDLTSKGMRALRGTLLRELGFDLFPVVDRLDRAVLIIEDRNLIVHNRGVVNEVYVRRTAAEWAKVGGRQIVGLVCAQRCMRFLAHAAADIDQRALGKFGLPNKPVTDECRDCISKANAGIPDITCGSARKSGPAPRLTGGGGGDGGGAPLADARVITPSPPVGEGQG